MSRFCNLCNRSFTSENGYNVHNQRYHQYPKPAPLPSAFHYHPLLNGAIYDISKYTQSSIMHIKRAPAARMANSSRLAPCLLPEITSQHSTRSLTARALSLLHSISSR